MLPANSNQFNGLGYFFIHPFENDAMMVDDHTQTPQELIQSSTRHMELSKEAYEKSKVLCVPQSSVDYSLLVQEVEEHLKSLKKIKSILDQQQLAHHVDVSDLELHLEEMIAHLPVGPSVLLHRDVEVLKRWSTVPKEETYQSSAGVFYHPKVSQQDLYGWFAPYVEKGNYFSSSCMFKMNKLGNKEFGRIFTCFTLIRTANQRQYEQQRLFPNDPPASGISTGMISKVKHFWNSVKNYSANVKNWVWKDCTRTEQEAGSSASEELELCPLPSSSLSIPTPTGGYLSLSFLKDTPDYVERQAEVIQDLYQTLSKQVEQWGFDSVQILTPLQQIDELGLSKETALIGDRILFFHKANIH